MCCTVICTTSGLPSDSSRHAHGLMRERKEGHKEVAVQPLWESGDPLQSREMMTSPRWLSSPRTTQSCIMRPQDWQLGEGTAMPLSFRNPDQMAIHLCSPRPEGHSPCPIVDQGDCSTFQSSRRTTFRSWDQPFVPHHESCPSTFEYNQVKHHSIPSTM